MGFWSNLLIGKSDSQENNQQQNKEPKPDVCRNCAYIQYNLTRTCSGCNFLQEDGSGGGVCMKDHHTVTSAHSRCTLAGCRAKYNFEPIIAEQTPAYNGCPRQFL